MGYGNPAEKPFEPGEPLLKQMADKDLEFDQKLKLALEVSASKPDVSREDCGFPDSYLFVALYRMNTAVTRLAELDESQFGHIFHNYRVAPRCSPEEVMPGNRLCGVLNRIIEKYEVDKTIGTGHFLRAISELSRDSMVTSIGYGPMTFFKTFSAETLMWGLGHTPWTTLTDAPEVQELLDKLEVIYPEDDFQYVLGMEEGRTVFRVTSIINDYALANAKGIITPSRAILTHYKNESGIITEDEIHELEDLINNPLSKEADLQAFFEKHPRFLRINDYREVFSQVYLTREDAGDLIPDFMLTNRELSQAMVLDLKTPKPKLIRRQNNRDRFTAAVNEAVTQLREYRDWFNEKQNREKLAGKIGMEVYQPKLAVVIGRSRDFHDEFDRQKLASRERDVEIYTYDDLIKLANRRRAIIEGL
jgi:hypothetical protein